MTLLSYSTPALQHPRQPPQQYTFTAVPKTGSGVKISRPAPQQLERFADVTGFLQIKSLETRVQDVLRFIPSLRNLLQPVNRLPPEILSRVAQRCLQDDAAVDTRLIVPLTHVCRYWRNCITSDPANWTRISNLSKELTILTLERAKASPLQVSFMGEGCTSPCVPVPYIQNIGTLSFIDLITIEALRQALPGFPQSTPNLRSLKLRQARRAVLDRSIDPFELLTPTLESCSLFRE